MPRIDLYSKILLTIIAVALVVLAGRPFFESRPATAGADRPCGVRTTEPCFIATSRFGAPLRVEVVKSAR